MSVYKPKGSPFYHFDFQFHGARFYGSTGCRDRRQAEAIERAERERAKALSKRERDLPRTYGESAARFWNEIGQHNATADDTLRNLVWLGNAIGEDTLLTEIDGDLVAQIIAKRRGERSKHGGALVTNATVNRTVTEPLKRLFKRARLWGVHLNREPDWRRLLLPEPQERVRELDSDESERIDAAMRADYEPFFSFARATGLRLRECFIQWDEIDWGARQIIKPGKGGRRVRIPITPTIRSILWPLQGHHPEAVFTYVATRTRDGRIKGQRYPLIYNGLKAAWRRLRKRAGVQNFRFHDFRHDFASKLLRETGNLKLVQRALNHADLQSTLRYAHVLDEDVAEALERHQKSRNQSRNNCPQGGLRR
jgi:integrase